jgi:hypothetical protein
MFYQALEANGGFLIIYQLQCDLVLIFRKMWLYIV